MQHLIILVAWFNTPKNLTAAQMACYEVDPEAEDSPECAFCCRVIEGDDCEHCASEAPYWPTTKAHQMRDPVRPIGFEIVENDYISPRILITSPRGIHTSTVRYVAVKGTDYDDTIRVELFGDDEDQERIFEAARTLKQKYPHLPIMSRDPKLIGMYI